MPELKKAVRNVRGALLSAHYSEAFITAGLIYLAITFIIIFGFKLIERKYLAYARA